MDNKEVKRKPLILRALALVLAICAVVGPVLLALIFSKTVKLNHPKGLKGVDVSEYQGEIDWAELSNDLNFAFIKATEGSNHTDSRFYDNWEGSASQDIAVGAYHFFSYDSSGATQAEHFINTVGDMDGRLPPVIDVEFYGDYERVPKPASEVRPELEAMISALEDEYGTKPIIYCTSKAYSLYGGSMSGCPLWYRNVYCYPFGKDWLFWQYSDTETLDGYSGDEKYIDANTFSGSAEDLDSLLIKR